MHDNEYTSPTTVRALHSVGRQCWVGLGGQPLLRHAHACRVEPARYIRRLRNTSYRQLGRVYQMVYSSGIVSYLPDVSQHLRRS